MPKLNECDLINIILFDVQQVWYIFEFKINQEKYNRLINYENQPETLHLAFASSFRFFL